MQFGNVPEMSARVVAACRARDQKPLITKLSPNQTDIARTRAACIDAGTERLAVINTVTGMAIDAGHAPARHRPRDGQAGLLRAPRSSRSR